MECQSSDSKKFIKVFDASKRKRTRKKREGLDDNSLASDDSANGCINNIHLITSAKASLQNTSTLQDAMPQMNSKRRDGISLALKAGLVSTPRSDSPQHERDGPLESPLQDQDSFIYAFFEEALKRDKKKHRHGKRHSSRDRDVSLPREHRHHRRHDRDRSSQRERERPAKHKSPSPSIDQAALFDTFAKLCAQFNKKAANDTNANQNMARTQSHKSLQCEVTSKYETCDEQRPERLHSHQSRDNTSPSRTQSHDHFRNRRSKQNITKYREQDVCACCPYEKERSKYTSKLDMAKSRMHNVDDDKYGYDRNADEAYRSRIPPDRRDYEERDPIRSRPYNDSRQYCEQKASRSFEQYRDSYDDERYRRTARSDGKEKRYEDYRDKRYDDRRSRNYNDRYNDVHDRNYMNMQSKDKRRSGRNLERCDRNSVTSRDDERYSERERDSGLSVADGETSTVSGKSNYLRVVKQEISEQREAMDKMMKLWKDLMRCFKGISQTQGQEKSVQENAANVQESAAAQLRLWRECMRRYETVARDVGDTDARLMEEINKQRSEMSEMASMWQECLQRYRDMSNDFNSLKQQLATSESPTRAPPLVCAEGEGAPPPQPYHLPAAYPHQDLGPPCGYAVGGSPLRGRASAPPGPPPGPPPWWWADPPAPRRRSSPDSRGSRERRHRHKDRERDDSRFKEKSKPSAARSEHRHRKR